MSLADSILSRERALRDAAGSPYGKNVSRRKLGNSVPLAARLTFLAGLIGHILRVSPEKQMRRVYAGRVVATMQDMQTVRYRAMVQLI